jgi:hypothetical protein
MTPFGGPTPPRIGTHPINPDRRTNVHLSLAPSTQNGVTRVAANPQTSRFDTPRPPSTRYSRTRHGNSLWSAWTITRVPPRPSPELLIDVTGTTHDSQDARHLLRPEEVRQLADRLVTEYHQAQFLNPALRRPALT